jgi:excisionase family DNA binding protein
MIGETGDDLEAAFYVVQRFTDGLRAGAPPVPKQVTDWCLKVRLTWETSADGPQIQDGTASFEVLYTVSEAAPKMGVTERQVRRLAKNGDIDARRPGREWLIAEQAVIDYLKGRKWPTSTQPHSS